MRLVRAHGESGTGGPAVPLTVDGLIYASSMVLLHSARRGLPVPGLARWLLGVGIAATLAANVAHDGWAHGPVGAAVTAWPAIALWLGSYELLMWLVRAQAAGPADQQDGLEQVRTKPASTEPEPAVHRGSGTVPGPDLDPDQAAIQAYQASTESGAPLSERKLAEQFGRTHRWARKIIAYARESPTYAAAERSSDLRAEVL